MAKRKLDPARPLTLRNFIDRRTVALGSVRGVEWVTDRYVLARRDLFRTPPQPAGLGVDHDLSRAIDRLLRRWRAAEPVELSDTRTVVDVSDPAVRLRSAGPSVRLLRGPDERIIAINGDVAGEWLTRGWAAIEQRGIPVTFWRRHAGRSVLVAAVMPVRLAATGFDGASAAEPTIAGTLRLAEVPDE